MVFLGRPTERSYVDHPRYPLKLPLQPPILKRLQLRQGGSFVPHQLITINLGDGPPGRETGLNTRRKGHHRQPVQDFLPIHKVVGAEVKVELDVAEAEDGQGADIAEARHAEKGRLDGNRNLSFDFFCRPPGILGDHLDHRRRGIRVGDNVKDMKGVEAAEEEGHAQYADKHPLDESNLDQPGDHGLKRAPEPSVNRIIRMSLIPSLPVL